MLRLWSSIVFVAFACACVAQTEPDAQEIDVANAVLEEVASLADQRVDAAEIAPVLKRLRVALHEAGVLENQTATQQRRIEPTAKPLPNSDTTPSQADLDRRQQETGKDYLPGPSLEQRAWRRAVSVQLSALEKLAMAGEIDHAALRRACEALEETLSQSPGGV